MSRCSMLVGVLALLITVVSTASLATDRSEAEPVAGSAARRYIAPIDGVIVDHFRPPSTVYAAGNRGLDEVTSPGSPVVASADGVVIFAGPVAGSLHVTIRHADGLRTTSSYLAALLVRDGDVVTQGQVIGLAAAIFHFGVRDVDGTYLNPEALFGGTVGAHLVPGPDEAAAPLVAAHERQVIEQLIRSAGSFATGVSARLAAVVAESQSLDPSVSLADLSGELERWQRGQQHCRAATSPRSAPPRRHLLVLVGGLGSTSERAAVDRIDQGALGYAAADVVRFSYAGGRVARSGPGASGPLESIPVTPYGPRDTEDDLRQSAGRLRTLLEQVARAEPGVPIDVIAHSEGGVVVRLALDASAADGALPAGLDTVVTLGTPHRGADLATAVVAAGPDTSVGLVAARLATSAGVDIDPQSPSITQLSQTSDVTAELARPVPSGVHLLSIGASGDLMVPAVRTDVSGGDSVTVHLAGLTAHDQLPSAPATTSEIARARAGERPTCQDLVPALGDVLTSHAITRAEAALGLALAGHRA